MRRCMKVAVLLLTVIAMTMGASAIAGEKANKPEKTQEAPILVDVPDGYMAIVQPGGLTYTLMPGSPDDFVLDTDGITILKPRTLRGNHVLGAAKNSFMAEAGMVSPRTEPPQLTACEGSYECGQLIITSVKPLRYSCMPLTCSGCSYWHETCQG